MFLDLAARLNIRSGSFQKFPEDLAAACRLRGVAGAQKAALKIPLAVPRIGRYSSGLVHLLEPERLILAGLWVLHLPQEVLFVRVRDGAQLLNVGDQRLEHGHFLWHFPLQDSPQA